MEYEGIVQSTNQKDLATYAMDRYAYYVCFKCNKAYYGGEARCDAEMGDKYNPQVSVMSNNALIIFGALTLLI